MMTDKQIMQLTDAEKQRLLDAVDAVSVEIREYLQPMNLTDQSARRFLYEAMRAKSFSEIVEGREPNLVLLLDFALQCLTKWDTPQ